MAFLFVKIATGRHINMPKKQKKLVRVNCGCGVQLLEGYINIDIVRPPNATKDNFREGNVLALPLETATVDYILMDNVLEHIPQSDVPVALYEIRRVLKKGGRAIIMVPEFTFLARQWLEMAGNTSMAFNPLDFHWLAETIYGNQNHEGEFHQCAIYPAYLNYVLHMVGLNDFKLIIHQAGGPLPEYPGMPGKRVKNATIRNDQLVADITKE
jgi:predicted SAM-dependent methyltransferase